MGGFPCITPSVTLHRNMLQSVAVQAQPGYLQIAVVVVGAVLTAFFVAIGYIIKRMVARADRKELEITKRFEKVDEKFEDFSDSMERHNERLGEVAERLAEIAGALRGNPSPFIIHRRFEKRGD